MWFSEIHKSYCLAEAIFLFMFFFNQILYFGMEKDNHKKKSSY